MSASIFRETKSGERLKSLIRIGEIDLTSLSVLVISIRCMQLVGGHELTASKHLEMQEFQLIRGIDRNFRLHI